VTISEELIAFTRESLALAQGVDMELIPFLGRGSDRAYYRIRWDPGNSAILIHYQTGRIENTYYVDIARFLGDIGIPVPEILRHDPGRCFILMKDLGDTDLWSLRNESWEARSRLYQKTLRIVHRLHSISEVRFPYNRVALTEAFGLKLYRWERNYFKENFVETLCAVKLSSDLSRSLEAELEDLAERLSSGRHSLVHRDLQSQNVMIYSDEPFLIDFQGMRFGTRFYDLGSILYDPYVSFSEEERRQLLRFYYELSEPEIDWNEFLHAFWEASVQRLMQALGAYGFLGVTKGLRNYLAHVPTGIRNLRAAAENTGSLPNLREVCVRCESALASSAISSLEGGSLLPP
jgi:N-acetylmuramate 1-kinase